MKRGCVFWLTWLWRAAWTFFIVVTWLAYFEIWENIDGISLDFISRNIGAPIGMTIFGAFWLWLSFERQ